MGYTVGGGILSLAATILAELLTFLKPYTLGEALECEQWLSL